MKDYFRTEKRFLQFFMLHMIASAILNAAFIVDDLKFTLFFLNIMRSKLKNLINDFDECQISHLKSRKFLIV